MSGSAEEGFRVVIPVKELGRAKTRLEVDGATRRRLALAFAVDTIEVALQSRRVEEVIALTRDSSVAREAEALGARVACPGGARDLNTELRWALGKLASTGIGGPVAVLMADLPALRCGEIDSVLAGALVTEGVFCVEDRSSGGTTLLGGPAGAVVPRFGGRSASRHRAGGARGLGAHLAGLRCDVDDLDSLAMAVDLGVNARTGDVLRARDLRVATTRAFEPALAGGARR